MLLLTTSEEFPKVKNLILSWRSKIFKSVVYSSNYDTNGNRKIYAICIEFNDDAHVMEIRNFKDNVLEYIVPMDSSTEVLIG